jgi:hypothetical protein
MRLVLLFGKDRGAGPKRELLAHLSEPRTTEFAIKHVKYKYNGHDRTPCLIVAVDTPPRHLQANRIARSPKGSRSSGGSDASRIDTSVRGDIVDLAARRTDIHELPVTQVAQGGSQSPAFVPFLKTHPNIS